MEKMEIFECSDVFIASYFTDDRGCAHCNREHTYFDSAVRPSDEILKMKMTEGIFAILNTDKSLYASLFDFVDPWKIDILEFMEKNYMNELSMEEMAYYTGRSLSSFKRDFRQYSDLTPAKWLLKRRLQAAYEMIRKGGRKVSDICYDVGFKNLSHFSKAYKDTFGISPTATHV